MSTTQAKPSKKTGPKKTSAEKNATTSPFSFLATEIPLSDILLDPNNYRFWDSKKFKKKVLTRFHESKVQSATLETLDHNYQLEELKKSILVNGYVPMERIIVTPYAHQAGKYVVVEGNRRIASLKALLKEAEEGVIELSVQQQESFKSVPCAVLQSKGKDLRHAERVIMGIRHIAGPREWGAYQQALLVSELKDEENLDFKEIGNMLGVSYIEAARRYRAVSALQQMEKDELYGSVAQPEYYRLFHEMVSSPEVRTFFGWSHEDNKFIDAEKSRQFFELISANGDGDPKLRTYGDVRRLKIMVGNTLAMEALLDPDKNFFDAIRIAEHGKNSITPGEIFKDILSTTSKLGVGDVKQLNKDDIQRIKDIIEQLNSLLTLASSKGTAKSK